MPPLGILGCPSARLQPSRGCEIFAYPHAVTRRRSWLRCRRSWHHALLTRRMYSAADLSEQSGVDTSVRDS
jgi:hypothetical protein